VIPVLAAGILLGRAEGLLSRAREDNITTRAKPRQLRCGFIIDTFYFPLTSGKFPDLALEPWIDEADHDRFRI